MRRSRRSRPGWLRGEAMGVRYPVMSNEESREIRSAIRRVFLDVWDPIRVSDEPNAQDEYDDGYIDRAFELLTTGGNDKEIVKYLLWITERMGMDGSKVSLQTVVAALRQIPISPA
jgi:hypothetical protein